MAIANKFPTIRPSLNLDFANSKTIDPRITFARASSATYFDEKGVMRTAPAGVPRIDHDPVTGDCKGLLIEEQRTRLNFVSAAPTVAENVTVTAVEHTVSFYGAGSIVLSGAHVATITGSGAFPTRTNLKFTPTAGTLTITPSGTVQHLQLEVGAFATSVIQGEGSQVTRAADTAVMMGTNFSDWYRQNEGTFVVESKIQSPTMSTVFAADAGSIAEELRIISLSSGSSPGFYANTGGVTSVASNVTLPVNTSFTAGGAYAVNNSVAAVNGTLGVVDTDCVLPSVNQLMLGRRTSGVYLNSHIKRLAYYPKRLTNEQLRALTA